MGRKMATMSAAMKIELTTCGGYRCWAGVRSLPPAGKGEKALSHDPDAESVFVCWTHPTPERILGVHRQLRSRKCSMARDHGASQASESLCLVSERS